MDCTNTPSTTDPTAARIGRKLRGIVGALGRLAKSEIIVEVERPSPSRHWLKRVVVISFRHYRLRPEARA